MTKDLRFSKPITVTVGEACRLIGIGRTKLYELIESGSIDSLLVGRRRLVHYASLETLVGKTACPAGRLAAPDLR